MLYVTGSHIFTLVGVRRHQIETWKERDVIKFQRNVIEFPCNGSSF